MNDWPDVILRDICSSVQYGYTTSASRVQVGPKFLRITDIVPSLINWEEVPYCEVSDKDRKKYLLGEGDIVVARTGATTGWAKRIKKPPEAIFASYLVRLQIQKEVDSEFIGAVVESNVYKEFIQKHMGGAAQPNASAQILTSFPLKLPPLPTQRKIAAILSAYDDLIENNTRRVQVLEQMARDLYREWFVEFRFPDHESAEFVEDEHGRRPEGWTRMPVSLAFEIDPRTKVDKDEVNAFVPMSSLSENSMVIEPIEERKGNSGAKFKNGDTLFARITPCLENGKTGFVNFLANESAAAFGSTEYIVMRSRKVCPEYVYLLARLPEFREHAKNSMSGATGRQRVRSECFNDYFIAVPDSMTLSRFEAAVKPMFEAVFNLAKRNANLRRTRDLLLPKLVSGELDVSALDVRGPGLELVDVTEQTPEAVA